MKCCHMRFKISMRVIAIVLKGLVNKKSRSKGALLFHLHPDVC